jgi:L-ribulose-5-phosphate 3-epimerase
MLLGYNTNGFAFHGLEDAVEILQELGYRAVGLTLDVHHLNPFDPESTENADHLREQLDECGMRCVVETGARFLLDARRKHQPTLVDSDPSERWRRTEFLEGAIGVAGLLRADAVSFWSGAAPQGDDEKAVIRRLEGEIAVLLPKAKAAGVPLAFEPEPGMAVATVEQGMELVRRIGDPLFGLTVDVGHVHCNREGDLPTILKSVGDRLFNVHLEDMKAGVHDHLMFGEGEMDFPPIFATLHEIGYRNGVYVELSRHAHDAVNAATQAMGFLRAMSKFSGEPGA